MRLEQDVESAPFQTSSRQLSLFENGSKSVSKIRNITQLRTQFSHLPGGLGIKLGVF